MAFPVVEATNHSVEASNTTTHTVSLPAGIQAGETLLVFFSCDSVETVTFPEGWTKIKEESYSTWITLAVAWRKADGEEGASITVTTGTDEESAHISYRISGATDPTSTPPEVSAGANSYGDTPDPASLTAGGGSKEYLWIAVEGNDDDEPVTDYPTNYTNGETYASSEAFSACSIGIARRNLETDTENPGAFTIADEEAWAACTVAVYPAIAAVGRSFGYIIG